MTFRVESGIPIPPFINRGRYSAKSLSYPFGVMQRGDSFSLGNVDPARVRAAAYQRTLKNPMETFTVRQMEDGTYRCWRER
jgi:hypothetical protein